MTPAPTPPRKAAFVAPRFQQAVPGGPASVPERRANGPTLVLLGNAAVGLLLAVTAAAVLLVKMRPPLEDELVKRGAAVCRATAADLQYSATVGDPTMAGRRLADLAAEPSARVAGAWLVAEATILSSWRRAGPLPTAAQLGIGDRGVAHEWVVSDGQRYALIGCGVEAIQGAEALSDTRRQSSAVGRLYLLIDTAEIQGTVRTALGAALWPLLAAIVLAMGLQLAIALFVIGRLNAGLRQLEATQGRLVKADKLAAVGTLSAGVAHEINNPLAYVISNLDYLSSECGPAMDAHTPRQAADLRQALAEAREGAERVRVIVRDLKALARGDEEKVAPLEVVGVVESSISIAMNELKHRARLVRDFGPTPRVDANSVRLGQVFLNLLMNAAHAIPEGAHAQNEIRVVTRTEADGRVAIEIRDTGCGIAPENMSKLFDPFFTTKAIGVGTGLGLWVCNGVVTSLGGEIQIESEIGRGTVVRVLLPPSKGGAAAEPAGEARRPAVRRARLLVVDDDALVGRAIERLLGPRHEVTCCTSAAEALERLGRGEAYDVILSDIMMPQMTGPDFYDRLRERYPHLVDRVVFVTGGAFTAGAGEFLRRVGNARVDKPFDTASLEAAVAGVLQRHEIRRAG